MPPPAIGPGEWNEPCAVQPSAVPPIPGSARRCRFAPRSSSSATTVAVAPPGGVVQRGPSHLTRQVDRDAEVEQEPGRLRAALRRGLVERLEELAPDALRPRRILARDPLRARAVTGEAEPDQLVDRPDLAPRAQLDEQLAEVRAAHAPRETVGRALVLRDPGVHVGAVLHEQADDLRRALAVDRPQQRALDLASRAVLEQQPDLRGILGVERVCQRVGPLDARARVEQQAQADVIGGLGRMVDGLAVVRVGARREQQRGHPRLMGDPRRAVERAERAELGVLPARVRVGARVEQRPRAVQQPIRALAAEEGGVGHVEQRQPRARSRRPRRRAGIARERRAHALGLPEHERGVESLAAQVGVEREQLPGVVAAAVGRLLDEPARALLAGHRLRLRAVHEPRPARLAELARDRELRVGEA